MCLDLRLTEAVTSRIRLPAARRKNRALAILSESNTGHRDGSASRKTVVFCRTCLEEVGLASGIVIDLLKIFITISMKLFCK